MIYWLLFLKTFTGMISVTIGIHALNKMSQWMMNTKEILFWCMTVAFNFTLAFINFKNCL